jgi:hypothetical protein
MKMKSTITALLIMALAAPAFASDKIKLDGEWLKRKHKQLVAVKDPSKVKSVGMWSSGDKDSDEQYTYFPNGNGRIVFEDKSWVLIVSHSIHQEDGLGDLTLVRASAGKYYVNKGHVCNKLILETKEKITSLETFLKAKGKGSKAEPVEWEEYKGEQPPAGDSKTSAEGAASGTPEE